MADAGTAMRTELSNMVNTHMTRISDAWDGYNIWELITSSGRALITLATATIMVIFTGSMLVILYAVTYAQVIWAQIAIAILIFLGPIFIPWLLFEPLSFLFWGWFRSLITFSLYGALAGAVMRVFMGVGLGYVTTYSNAVVNFDLVTMAGWVLIILPLFVAGILASLKVGALASMLVSGQAVTSSGRNGSRNGGSKWRRLRRRRRAEPPRLRGRGNYEQRERRNRKDLRRDLGGGDPLQPALAGSVDGLGRTLPFADNNHHPAVIG